MMTKIERLYGVKDAYWMRLPYDVALEEKIACANTVISEIHSKKFCDVTNDDSQRKNECLNAIRFNEGLLNE